MTNLKQKIELWVKSNFHVGGSREVRYCCIFVLKGDTFLIVTTYFKLACNTYIGNTQQYCKKRIGADLSDVKNIITSVPKKSSITVLFLSHRHLQQNKALLTMFIHGHRSLVEKKRILSTNENHLGLVFTRHLKKGVGSSRLLLLVKVVLEQQLLVLKILALYIQILGF